MQRSAKCWGLFVSTAIWMCFFDRRSSNFGIPGYGLVFTFQLWLYSLRNASKQSAISLSFRVVDGSARDTSIADPFPTKFRKDSIGCVGSPLSLRTRFNEFERSSKVLSNVPSRSKITALYFTRIVSCLHLASTINRKKYGGYVLIEMTRHQVYVC